MLKIQGRSYQLLPLSETLFKLAIADYWFTFQKNKAGQAVHIVRPGESLHDISQFYAIRLKKLCKYNTLTKDATLYPNQQIKLR